MRPLTPLLIGAVFFVNLGELSRVSGQIVRLQGPTPALLQLAGEQDKTRKDTGAYLRKLQDDSGGFRPNVPGSAPASASLRATLSAVRALRYLDAEVPDLEACRKFVQKCYSADAGAFTDSPGGKADVLANAIGLMAVVDLKMPTDKFSGAVKYLEENAKSFDEIRISAAAFESLGKDPLPKDMWLKEIRKLENADGAFGESLSEARDTGGAVAAVLRLGGKLADPDAAIKAMKNGQRKSGGFSSGIVSRAGPDADLETSYRIMRSLVMLKSRPADVKALQGFIAKCRNSDGGYGVSPGAPSSASATYFAAIIMHWLKK